METFLSPKSTVYLAVESKVASHLLRHSGSPFKQLVIIAGTALTAVLDEEAKTVSSAVDTA